MEQARQIPDVPLDQLAMDLDSFVHNQAAMSPENQEELAQRFAWSILNQARHEEASRITIKCTKEETEIIFQIDDGEYPILKLEGNVSKFIKMVLTTIKNENLKVESTNQGDLWTFAFKLT